MSDKLSTKRDKMVSKLEFVKVHFRKRLALSANSKVCSGCRTCELICSLSHEGSFNPEHALIYIKSNPLKGSFVPMICHQCSDAPCYYACPESAIEIDRDLGTLNIRRELCTGCRECVEACPYKVIRFSHENNVAIKCDLCKGDPQCVKWCPLNALGVVEFAKEVL